MLTTQKPPTNPPQQHPPGVPCTFRNKCGKGREIEYRNMTLVVPKNVPFPTCVVCGKVSFNDEQKRRLNEVLKGEYEKIIAEKGAAAIDLITRPRGPGLKPFISQRKLELLLGVSQGYFARVRARNGQPSTPLVLLLSIISEDPLEKIDSIRRFLRDCTPPLKG